MSCLNSKSAADGAKVAGTLEPIVALAKYRKLLGLDFCHDLRTSCIVTSQNYRCFMYTIKPLTIKH